MTSKIYDEFIEYVKDLSDVQRSLWLLEWDQETYMPEGSTDNRARMMATMTGLEHRLITDKKMGEWLDKLMKKSVYSKLSDVQKTNVRETARNYEKATALPEKLVKDLAHAKSTGFDMWVRARKEDNFDMFAPSLDKLVDLNIQVAEARGYEGHPYNALLDDYEPNLTIKTLDPVLNKLEKDLVPIVKKVLDSDFKPRKNILTKKYDIKKQEEFARSVITDMGFNWDIGRLDRSAHPFTIGLGRDVRITTRYDEKFLPMSIFGTIHEAGHAMYEQGFLEEHNGTPMAEAISMGYHESQSRLWENLVGRSKPFWQHYYPLLQKTFSRQLKNVSLEEFYAAINNVERSFIRVEADELTYNLHILLRYNIELMLIDGKINAKEAPQVWNEKMEEYLGVVPPNNTLGVLQDIHWSQGYFGYFPTYTLGNLYGAQLFHQAKKDIRGLETNIAKGNFAPLKEWLNKNIHQHGKMYSAEELTKKITGESLNTKYWVDYAKRKFGPIYGVKL